jgi:hypothetical protein
MQGIYVPSPDLCARWEEQVPYSGTRHFSKRLPNVLDHASGVHNDRPGGFRRGRGARMNAGHRRAESQEFRTCHPGLAGEDSAPGWLCAAYDEHPGAGIDNHNASRNRRSAIHAIRGAP